MNCSLITSRPAPLLPEISRRTSAAALVLRTEPAGVALSDRTREGGYYLIEALTYISAVMLLLGLGLLAMFRCVDSSLVLRRNAEDIARTVHMGERWRADIRSATKVAWVREDGEEVLQLEGSKPVRYRYAEGAVYRRVGSGPWGRLLESVKTSAMGPQVRSQVTVWSWDIELQPPKKGSVPQGRMRPLFTFTAVPRKLTTP